MCNLKKSKDLNNDPSVQSKCLVCEKNLQRKRKSTSGKIYYGLTCQGCHEVRIGYSNNSRGSYKYRKHKKDHCESCGFIPEDPCQLDVDHIDGNHKNNSPDNLQTLCANCHRLKSHKARRAKRDLKIKWVLNRMRELGLIKEEF